MRIVQLRLSRQLFRSSVYPVANSNGMYMANSRRRHLGRIYTDVSPPSGFYVKRRIAVIWSISASRGFITLPIGSDTNGNGLPRGINILQTIAASYYQPYYCDVFPVRRQVGN